MSLWQDYDRAQEDHQLGHWCHLVLCRHQMCDDRNCFMPNSMLFPAKKKLHGQFMDFSRELAIFASLLSARKMKPHPTESPGSRGVEVPRTHWSAQNVLKSRVAMVEINPLIGSLSHQIHRSQNPPKNPTRRAQICKTRKVGSSWSLCP